MDFLARFPARSLTAFAAVAGSLAVLSVARPVAAEPTFPSVIQKVYGGDCAVQCTLCHSRPEGGAGYYQPSGLDPAYVPKMAANTGEGAFFANFINVIVGTNHQPLPSSDGALENDLRTYASAKCNTSSSGPCDSDGDGVTDAKEFAEKPSGDPNVAGGDLCIGPTYGCGATITPLPRESSASWRAAAVLAALGAGLVVARRVQRR
jgi:hypothetical protein